MTIGFQPNLLDDWHTNSPAPTRPPQVIGELGEVDSFVHYVYAMPFIHTPDAVRVRRASRRSRASTQPDPWAPGGWWSSTAQLTSVRPLWSYTRPLPKPAPSGHRKSGRNGVLTPSRGLT